MKVIIGVEGTGIRRKKQLSYFLNKAYPGIDIQFENTQDCDLIIKTCWGQDRLPLWITSPKKYILWSIETYLVDNANNPYCVDSLHFAPYIHSTMSNFIYFPFALCSPYLYLERKYTNTNRKYVLAYCNSHVISEREKLFDMFIEKTSIDVCHAYGECCGSYKNSQKTRIPGGWNDERLIDAYKDYTFVIAMENSIVDGYVTEKILNAFYSGAIPIYWGSSNINDIFNKDAFINVRDFKTFEECVQYVIHMTDDEINTMMSQPIYNTASDLANLLNDEYNNINKNIILETYVNIIKKFLD